MSIVLAIDTSTPAVTAGVVADGSETKVLAERVSIDARGHAERITPNVLAALADAALSMADLDAVVVGCGPGPFTGLRVGMATAAAYGHALGLPVYGVCSLDAIGGQTTGEVLVVTDARRREVYWARYRDGVRIGGPAVNAPADVDPGPAQSVAGSPDHAALFGLPCREPMYPDVAGVVAAVSDWSQPPGALVPLYLRRPDAKTLAERDDDAGRNGPRRSHADNSRDDDAGRNGPRRSHADNSRDDDAGRNGPRRSHADNSRDDDAGRNGPRRSHADKSRDDDAGRGPRRSHADSRDNSREAGGP